MKCKTLRTFNQGVEGSNPAAGTREIKGLQLQTKSFRNKFSPYFHQSGKFDKISPLILSHWVSHEEQ